MSGDRKQDLVPGDIQALIRLSGEMGEIGNDLGAKREHCVTQLARLCYADKGVFAEFSGASGAWMAVPASVQFLNTPHSERLRLTRFYVKNEPADPVIDHMGKAAAIVLAGRPGDFLSETAWRTSEHYNVVRRPAGVVEQIYAHHRIEGIACGIGLHRRSAKSFQLRDVRLVETFMRGAGQSLHRRAALSRSEDAGLVISPASLPPRLTAVLSRFLLGETEKEVAKYLGVTRHTVHSYAKQIYHRLGVSSRSELLARFIRRP